MQSVLTLATANMPKTIHDFPDIMRVGDVKEYLGIGTNAAYDFLHHPKCPTLRFGNSLRIRKDKFLQFLDDMENGAEMRA